MPRTMDADERHRIVSEAAWRVLVRDGPAELSVRKVAAEAGLPPSSLRYTFPTQASVREAAVGLLIQRLAKRVERAASAERRRDSARAILLELLPLDEERRAEMEVTVAFLTLAMTDPSLREAYERTHEAVRDVCAQALAHLGAHADRIDLTHAVIDGLAFHLLGRKTGSDTSAAVAALDTHLDLIEPTTGVTRSAL
ncbi:TetR/AcrR family transcriptional regulator [Marisediminicola sp. LYQ134]|uniref:TetR/AcrR family transcriptional regulator n=1 Tax=unclassified Marisediminicola TaxID=2618316 RepID=UPI003983411A